MKATTALIADDEPLLREHLAAHLARQWPELEVVAEARNGREALELHAAHAPDALFLDVQMPEVDGLSVAASLPDPAPAVVFVTAFDHYALPAFDAAALDYLLKPADAEHVARAVQRLLSRGSPTAPAARPAPTQLVIPDRGRTWLIAVRDIEWLEAADNYVVVHAGARAPLLRRTLTALLADLGDTFVRTQRGAAVALAHVGSVQALPKGDAQLLMRSGAQVPCSRQFRSQLMERLQSSGRTSA